MPHYRRGSRWEQGKVCRIGDKPQILTNNDEVLSFSYRLIRWHGNPRAGIQVGDLVSFARRSKSTRVSLVELHEVEAISRRGVSRDINMEDDGDDGYDMDDTTTGAPTSPTMDMRALSKTESSPVVDFSEFNDTIQDDASSQSRGLEPKLVVSGRAWRYDPYSSEGVVRYGIIEDETKICPTATKVGMVTLVDPTAFNGKVFM
eukprot:Hpha_TRINITY_DN15624_c1_g1::TRINITY_DN15624_c1_g1_i1::g.99205::m.99205